MITLVGASLLLASCADRRDPVAPEHSASEAVVSAAPRLSNATYTMTLGPEDFPPFFPPEVVQLLTGDWELDLTETRRYVTRLNGDDVVVGRYTANPARLVLDGGSGPLACAGDPGIGQGVHAWSLDGDELSLASIQDKCHGRAFVLTVKPWHRQ